MNLFDFCLDFLTVAAEGWLQYDFSRRRAGEKFRFGAFAVYFAVLYAIAISATDNFRTSALQLAALYAVNRVFLRAERSAACVSAFMAVYLTCLSFGVTGSLESLVLPRFLGRHLLVRSLLVIATLLALLLNLLCCELSLRQFPAAGNQPETQLLLPPCLFFFIAEFYILQTSYWQSTVTFTGEIETGKHLALLALQVLGLGALFSALYAYRRVCDGFRTQAALNALAQENHAQRTYVAQAQARYERTQSFRHDLKNHLTILDGLMRRGDMAQAREYLGKLDAAAETLSFSVHTGNPVIDTLLGDKLALADAEGIKISLSLVLPQPHGAVNDLDLCAIFANALDNAITACRETEEEKRIQITGARQGDFYLLEFQNSCAPGPLPPMGIGLTNIRTAAEKHGGTMSTEKLENRFRLSVLLNLSQDL